MLMTSQLFSTLKAASFLTGILPSRGENHQKLYSKPPPPTTEGINIFLSNEILYNKVDISLKKIISFYDFFMINIVTKVNQIINLFFNFYVYAFMCVSFKCVCPLKTLSAGKSFP